MRLQSLSVVNKPAFRNCLVAMRPKTRTKELPSIHGVNTHIHNEFAKHLDEMKEEFKASVSFNLRKEINHIPINLCLGSARKGVHNR